jgi:hypothetical protein
VKRDYKSASVQVIEEKENQAEDAICTNRKGKFSDDVQGEIWVQCVMCEDITLEKKICSFLCLKLL